jgi:hypothetical protein
LRRAVGGGHGRRVGLVAVEGDVDPADAEQGEALAVVGTRIGTRLAMDGTGVTHPDRAPGPPLGQALGRARAGAAPAMRSLPAGLTRGAAEFAVDPGGAAGAAGAGAGAAARGEVGVAAQFVGGGQWGRQGRRIGGRGGGESGVWHPCFWQYV